MNVMLFQKRKDGLAPTTRHSHSRERQEGLKIVLKDFKKKQVGEDAQKLTGKSERIERAEGFGEREQNQLGVTGQVAVQITLNAANQGLGSISLSPGAMGDATGLSAPVPLEKLNLGPLQNACFSYSGPLFVQAVVWLGDPQL